jgi:hypothetical protein
MLLKSFNARMIYGRRQWQSLIDLQASQMRTIAGLEELLYSMVVRQLDAPVSRHYH